MDTLEMHSPAAVTPDTVVLPAYCPVPGLGILPINAYLIKGAQPVLVDTGAVALTAQFMERLREAIDLNELRWIFLTHADPDHVGSLHAVLDEAPNARLVTTYLGMGKLGLSEPVPPDRVYLLNPGQSLDVGDRQLVAVRPPCFDAPETTAVFDGKTRTLFSSDCFGALMSAPADAAEAIAEEPLRDGLVTWTGVDAPWISSVPQATFEVALDAVRALAPEKILGAHLPPATRRETIESLYRFLRDARGASPFVGPDQKAMMEMLAA
jgi:glyoxylase-like metal-dependent hydrolase (beta-lactamase superfamily II)